MNTCHSKTGRCRKEEPTDLTDDGDLVHRGGEGMRCGSVARCKGELASPVVTSWCSGKQRSEPAYTNTSPQAPCLSIKSWVKRFHSLPKRTTCSGLSVQTCEFMRDALHSYPIGSFTEEWIRLLVPGLLQASLCCSSKLSG